MYPLKFKKVFKEKIWGGRKLETLLSMELPLEKNIGESWEVASHKNGMSIVEEGEFSGKPLDFLLKEYKEKLVGEKVYEKFQDNFPLLIKYLDVNDRLSVQVHPSDEYALRIEGEFGKSESWYIIDASSDAKLIMGLSEGITRDKFQEKVKNKDFSDLFNIISVKKGDFINVNPGLVHASLEGWVLICETQQNSDTTYRIYDFDRLVDGHLRPLHLEKASEVIAFGEKSQISTEEGRVNIIAKGASIQELVRGEYFSIDKIKIMGTYSDKVHNTFTVLSILEGNGKIIHKEKEYQFKKGDSYFIPANLEITLVGQGELLKSYI